MGLSCCKHRDDKFILVQPKKAWSLHTTLRVSDLNRTVGFYTQTLGMRLVHEADGVALLGWPDRGSLVEFMAVPNREGGWCKPDTKRDAFVWLGLSNIPWVSATIDSLQQQQPPVSCQLQGQLISDTGPCAFVGHISDPDEYTLEVLQTAITCNVPMPDPLPTNPLRADRPVLGQLKFNTKDPNKTLKFYVDTLGMTLLSKCRIAKFKLTLWFLAFTDEQPPQEAEIDSPENREWLWRAQFSQLELQHWDDFELDVPLKVPPADGNLGFAALTLACPDPEKLAVSLAAAGIRTIAGHETMEMSPLCGGSRAQATFLDPDGRALRLVKSGVVHARL